MSLGKGHHQVRRKGETPSLSAATTPCIKNKAFSLSTNQDWLGNRNALLKGIRFLFLFPFG